MAVRKETGLAPRGDAFGMLRQMASELDRMFEEPFRMLRPFAEGRTELWTPGIDVFEKDNHLVTKVDLPGMKKEDVKIEVTDGHLAISGERKSEAEEKKDNYYRCEREYGSFYRSVPLPEGVKLEDIKATFANGVLEVRVPLPARVEPKARKVEIEEPAKDKTAA